MYCSSSKFNQNQLLSEQELVNDSIDLFKMREKDG